MIKRTPVVALVFSLAGFVGLAAHEYYTDTAVIPTKNDRWTVGFGSTFRDDGSPVRQGDTIDPVQAIKRSAAHIAKDETALKKCVTGPMTQGEYDVLVDFFYQYGQTMTCSSGMVRNINAGDYEAACNFYAEYRKSGGYDCSTLVNGKPNKRCWGVWDRNRDRRDKCLEAGK